MNLKLLLAQVFSPFRFGWDIVPLAQCAQEGIGNCFLIYGFFFIKLFLVVVFLISVIVLIYIGLVFVIGIEEKRIEETKKWLVFVILGLIISFLALTLIKAIELTIFRI